jgi:hypothetical protein
LEAKKAEVAAKLTELQGRIEVDEVRLEELKPGMAKVYVVALNFSWRSHPSLLSVTATHLRFS